MAWWAMGALSLACGGSAWAAESLSTRQDPVEQASAALSQTIAAHQAEQAQLMQMQAQAFALLQQGAFSQPFQRATQSTAGTFSVSPTIQNQGVSSVSTLPTVQSVILGQGGLAWLAGQADPLVTGIQPVAGREGLLVSYAVPSNDPLASLRGRSWTYDDAVAAIAFLLQGHADTARTVLSALQGLMAPDGTLGFSYQVDSSFMDGHVRTGTMAWVGYAMALYQRQTGDTSFQAGAEKIAGTLKGFQLASGSLRGGPDVSWVSTEHNVDAYFFYRELYRVTGKAAYQATAGQIEDSLLKNHWVSTRSGGHFLQGIGDPTPALDANSWGALFLSAIGRTAQADQALQYVESTFKDTEKVSGTKKANITGYSPDSAQKTVWLEGTAGVALAYQRAGQATQADSVLGQIKSLQAALQSAGSWNGALPYATPRYTNAEGDTYSDLQSVVSTAWLQIVLDLQDGSSPFWDPN